MVPPVHIEAATADDADQIATIYNHYVANTVVTFDEQAFSAELIGQRITDLQARQLPFLVMRQGGQVIGYAYAGDWKPRTAYRFSTETTIYLKPQLTGRGLGRQLYEFLLNQLAANGMHSAIAGITLPNQASVALHEALGFSKVAHFSEVGRKFDRWLDVGYWQRLL